MPRARGFVLTVLGSFLAVGAAGVPLVAGPTALAAQEAAQYCVAGKSRRPQLQRLAARFDDRGNEDPADDRLEATLTLCGRPDPKLVYVISLDVRPPLFTDADRNGNGQVGRKDFCAETRDFVVRWRPRHDGEADRRGVTSRLLPGRNGAPDRIRFRGPVKALERALGEKLPRDGSRTVFVWAEARPRAEAAAHTHAYASGRRAVDRLPVTDRTDGCARPQVSGEALAVTLTDPSTETFGYTGDLQTYTVPAGVSSVKLTVTGATGGSGYLPGGIGGGGGASAQVTGILSVTPGQQLTIDVGEAGGNGTGTGSGSGGAGGSPFDDDAAAGNGGDGDGTGAGGGGGGAATIVFSDPATNRILVIAGGGGGGGGGGCFFGYNGGGGGGAGPQTGSNGAGNGANGSGAGYGAGGAAAWAQTPGGGGGAASGTLAGGGGGGGGGLAAGQGGGAGGSGCGGGGGGGAGSNFTAASVAGVVITQAGLPAATDGSVVITLQ